MSSSGSHLFNVIEYGTVTIAAGATYVAVNFSAPHSYPPAVILTTGNSVNGWVEDVTPNGFTCKISAPLESTVNIYYQVISMP